MEQLRWTYEEEKAERNPQSSTLQQHSPQNRAERLWNAMTAPALPHSWRHRWMYILVSAEIQLHTSLKERS